MASLNNAQKTLLKSIATTIVGSGNKRAEIHYGELPTAKALQRRALLILHRTDTHLGPHYEANMTAAGWARITALANKP